MIPVVDGPVGVSVSGGADSALLLYFLMKQHKHKIHIFTLADKSKFYRNAKQCLHVVDWCRTCCNFNNFEHHIIHSNQQNAEELLDLPRKYCEDNRYMYKLADQELIMKNSFITLNSLIKKLDKSEGIIMCSLHMLPETKFREKILDNIINKGIQVHFVFEKFILNNKNDIEDLEDFLNLNNIIENQSFNNSNFLKKIKLIS